MESSTAGPSSSTEFSASGPSSSGPAAIDSSESERDYSQEPRQEGAAQVVSLLSRLKAPRPSDFARKRKIAANPPSGKRRSRGASDTELTSIKPEKRVKEHPNEPLTVSNGKLFCRGCREELL